MGLESQVISVVEVLVSNISIFVNTPSHVLGGGIWLETCLGLCLHVRQFWVLQPVEMECVSAEVCWGFLTILFGLCIPSKGDAVSSSRVSHPEAHGAHLVIWSQQRCCVVPCFFVYLTFFFFPLLAINHWWSSILESIYTSCYLWNFPTGSMDDSWPSQSLIW